MSTDLLFLGIVPSSPHRFDVVALLDGKRLALSDQGPREATYWLKNLCDGLFASLEPMQLLKDAGLRPLRPKAEAFGPSPFVVGLALDKSEVWAAALDKKGQLADVTLLQAGPKPIVVQAAMIHIAKTILAPLLAEPHTYHPQ